jgi:hypothetical protein
MAGTRNLFKNSIIYVEITRVPLLLFSKPLTFKPQIKPQTLKNKSQIALPINFKSKTQTVDYDGEVGVLLIEKKYNKFGGLSSYVQP